MEPYSITLKNRGNYRARRINAQSGGLVKACSNQMERRYVVHSLELHKTKLPRDRGSL